MEIFKENEFVKLAILTTPCKFHMALLIKEKFNHKWETIDTAEIVEKRITKPLTMLLLATRLEKNINYIKKQ